MPSLDQDAVEVTLACISITRNAFPAGVRLKPAENTLLAVPHEPLPVQSRVPSKEEPWAGTNRLSQVPL